MFDISWTEFLLIGIVALIVIGPKELPGVLRTLGQWTRKVRSMAADFQNQFHEAMREAEMADLKKQVDDLAQDFTNIDPLKSVRDDVAAIGKDLEKSGKDIEQSLQAPAAEPAPAEPPVLMTGPPALPAAGDPMPIDPMESREPETVAEAVAPPEAVTVPPAPADTERSG
jgi:sec-independent protein translocase protein TatB